MAIETKTRYNIFSWGWPMPSASRLWESQTVIDAHVEMLKTRLSIWFMLDTSWNIEVLLWVWWILTYRWRATLCRRSSRSSYFRRNRLRALYCIRRKRSICKLLVGLRDQYGEKLYFHVKKNVKGIASKVLSTFAERKGLDPEVLMFIFHRIDGITFNHEYILIHTMEELGVEDEDHFYLKKAINIHVREKVSSFCKKKHTGKDKHSCILVL